MTIFRQNLKKLSEKWSLGVDFFENNLKNPKVLLKNILHVKGSEVILDFKGTF